MAPKKLNKLNKSKVIIDPALDQYVGKSLFPEKLAKANEMVRKAGIPNQKKKGQ